jgi:hypothetical protein
MADRSSPDFATARGEPRGREVSGWAVGGAVFAAVMMIMIGVFHVIAGITAIVKGRFYAVTPTYLLTFNVRGWGWIHLVLGVVLVLAGWYVFSGSPLARGIGITVAALSAIGNFLFIPYYPFWSILMIALDVFVIWALAAYGRRAAAGY